MQFLQASFEGVLARHTLPSGGADPPSRHNPHDAINAAAFYLCDNGASRGDVRAAIFSYNHAGWYVHQVLDQARKYGDAAASVDTGHCDAIQATTAVALVAVNYACEQQGLPYVWGGNGPQNGGFDCSGLTAAAYGAAGMTWPRNADAQFRAGSRVPDGQPLLPGDLVFYGTAAHIHHVGLYLGAGLMIDAPDVGQRVKVGPSRRPSDAYVEAIRLSKIAAIATQNALTQPG